MQHIEQEIETHHELQSAGVSVIPRFELCQGEQGATEENLHYKPFIDSDGACCKPMWICATDLTENGKNYVLSQSNKTIDDEEWTRRWANGEFSHAVPNIESALHQLAVDTLKIAVLDKEIQLEDAFLFIIDKVTRHTTVIVGDYKHVRPSYGRSASEVGKNNLIVARQACLSMKHLLGVSDEHIHAFFESKISRVLSL